MPLIGRRANRLRIRYENREASRAKPRCIAPLEQPIVRALLRIYAVQKRFCRVGQPTIPEKKRLFRYPHRPVERCCQKTRMRKISQLVDRPCTGRQGQRDIFRLQHRDIFRLQQRGIFRSQRQHDVQEAGQERVCLGRTLTFISLEPIASERQSRRVILEARTLFRTPS